MTHKIRVGINGFGRIGRTILRAAMKREDIEIVAINDLLQVDHLAYLLKYDSVHGGFQGHLSSTVSSLDVNGEAIRVFSEAEPKSIGWGEVGVDLVIESTGLFLSADLAHGHLAGGAGKVLLSAPPKDDTPVFVMGVNADNYGGESIVSNASCTTNCVAPLAKSLNDAFGIEEALMLTVHATTSSQNTVDGVAKKDWRFGRGILENIIPATTGAARMVGRVVPELDGRINGMAVRVPVSDVSMIDLTCRLRESASYEDICVTLREHAHSTMKGILSYCDEPVVSTDMRGNPHSSIVDGAAGMQVEGGLTKIVAWYDNEWGYASRCLDLAAHIMC